LPTPAMGVEVGRAERPLVDALSDASRQLGEDTRNRARRLDYAQASSAWVFDDSLGDSTDDDQTLAKDRPDGVRRTQVLNLFNPQQKALPAEAVRHAG
jgi:hypothetical protein